VNLDGDTRGSDDMLSLVTTDENALHLSMGLHGHSPGGLGVGGQHEHGPPTPFDMHLHAAIGVFSGLIDADDVELGGLALSAGLLVVSIKVRGAAMDACGVATLRGASFPDQGDAGMARIRRAPVRSWASHGRERRAWISSWSGIDRMLTLNRTRGSPVSGLCTPHEEQKRDAQRAEPAG
jgi:hypothetical protein